MACKENEQKLTCILYRKMSILDGGSGRHGERKTRDSKKTLNTIQREERAAVT
jgi:hypothetical protein